MVTEPGYHKHIGGGQRVVSKRWARADLMPENQERHCAIALLVSARVETCDWRWQMPVWSAKDPYWHSWNVRWAWYSAICGRPPARMLRDFLPGAWCVVRFRGGSLRVAGEDVLLLCHFM